MSETTTYLAQFGDWGGRWCDDGNVYASARDAHDGCIATLSERGYSGADVRVLRVTTTQTIEVVDALLDRSPAVNDNSTEGMSPNGAMTEGSPAATTGEHDPHARLAPELVALLDDWDANAEDDNYSKGDAANDLRKALTRACGCERGLLPHDRRCPSRLDQSRPAATTGEVDGYWLTSKPSHGWSCDCDDESGHVEQREWVPAPVSSGEAALCLSCGFAENCHGKSGEWCLGFEPRPEGCPAPVSSGEAATGEAVQP
jgi:hypothetical protein